MFQVGKKVIAIANAQYSKRFKKGDVFTVIGIRVAPCCKIIELDLGFTTELPIRCVCNLIERNQRTFWVGTKKFIPYDDSLSTITAESLIEQLELQTA